MTESRSAADQRSRSLALAENLTLWSLLATASLFTAGQIAHAYEFDALGLRSLRVEAAWQDRVFEGGLGILNMLLKAVFEPGLMHLPWLGAAAVFAACLWWRAKLQSRPRTRAVLGALAACAWLAVLILISIGWGRSLAAMIRGNMGTHEHFVFAPDATIRLPPALLQDNEQRTLKLVTTTSDFFVLLSADGARTYRIATRDIELQETTRDQ
jgi:hypothetical protein